MSKLEDQKLELKVQLIDGCPPAPPQKPPEIAVETSEPEGPREGGFFAELGASFRILLLLAVLLMAMFIWGLH